ncbi:MAG: hypothetical protein K6F49_12075 [Saccharofermentans sp.]|nr:hypothetical protein [Saccharofermentans sp.]
MDIYTTHYVYIVDGKEHLNIDAFNSDLDRLFGYPEFDVSNIEAFRDSFPYGIETDLYWMNSDKSIEQCGKLAEDILSEIKGFEGITLHLDSNDIPSEEYKTIRVHGSRIKDIRELDYLINELCDLPPLAAPAPDDVCNALIRYQGIRCDIVVEDFEDMVRRFGGIVKEYADAVKKASLTNRLTTIEIK